MASRSFKCFVEQEMGKFPQFVIYAILEWIIIILLFLDGLISYFCNEFANFFEMKIPCLLCTRIDHVFVRRDSNFYYNESICENHKKDVSSFAYCHMHRRLSDIRSMCERCLLSFATEKEADIDTYKSLVGILHKDIDTFLDDDHLSNSNLGRKEEIAVGEKDGVQRCSCCGEPLKLKVPSKQMARNNSSMNPRILSQGPAPSPRAPLMAWRNEDTRNPELPHIRYSELRFHDELQEDEDGSHLEKLACGEDNKAASVPLLPETDEFHEDAAFARTPSFAKGNKFFGIPLSDSASASPRWASRLPRKLQLEKSELFAESHDGPTDSDGDSILNRLKRQVRLDRKSLIELYMELDEERSASAVAANNAMAMITRLQAEKAAVQMEALQYQRMMDEQAEYDQEALQMMKDMLAKKEEETKALEADLESYREKYGPITRVGSEEGEVDDEEDYQEMKSQPFERSDSGSPSEGGRQGRGSSVEEMSLDFEGERAYLLGLLKNLEKKVAMSMGNENRASITREMSLIRERLRGIEADSGFLKQAAMTLQKGGEGTKLLTEIAVHLRKLRQSVKLSSEDI
ncbi:hypothetical protein NMG60_11009558 [Bertholletia excelsa]